MIVFLVLLGAIACAMPALAQVRLSPQAAEGRLVEQTDPVYPPLATATRLQGTVKVDVTVSESGRIASTKLISGHPLVVPAALDAIKKRRYTPYVADGGPTSFVATVEIAFSMGVPKEQYERQQALSDKYFKLEDKCRALFKSGEWNVAEQACKAAVPSADQLGDHQGLTKMGAYENVGHTLLAQGRYQESLDYYSRAFEFAQSSLKGTDAELGYAYRNLAMANHGLRNLEAALKLYAKAEQTIRLARERIEGEDFKIRYDKALRETLKYHLLAAEEAGSIAEAQDIRKRLGAIP